MKTFITAVALTAASLALCAMSAKATIPLVTTSYDTVNFSATITTNKFTATTNKDIVTLKYTSMAQKFVTKNLLDLLTNSDFAGTSFSTGSKLVIGWDWNGDLLVVDKTGTNILYDATTHTRNSTNYVAINFYNQKGSPNYSETANITNMTGTISLAWFNNGSFKLIDQAGGINITGTGPCTEHFNFKDLSTNNVTWSDSQSFTMYGANETNGASAFPGTLTGSITASGKGTGTPAYLGSQIEALAP